GEAREAYLQKILATRLFGALPADARSIACRLALSELPLPVDAVILLTGHDQQQAVQYLENCVAFGLLQRFDESGLPSLYQPPGLLRPWLSAPERLSLDDARAAHRHLAQFWKSTYENDREQELRVPIDVELSVCRIHSKQGGDSPTFRWASRMLARRLSRR